MTGNEKEYTPDPAPAPEKTGPRLGDRVRAASAAARRRAPLVAALAVTGLSMPLTVWAGLDLVGRIGLVLGVVLDSVVVAAVVIAWRNPTGWRMAASLGVASLSVALVGYHGTGMPALGWVGALLGGVPAVAALLWHMVLTDRAARLQEEAEQQAQHARVSRAMADEAAAQKMAAEARRRELSPDMGYEARVDIASRYRELDYQRELFQVQGARQDLEHRARMDEMRRAHEASIAEIRMSSDLEVGRIVAEARRMVMMQQAPAEISGGAAAPLEGAAGEVEAAPLEVGFAAGFGAPPWVAHSDGVEHAHSPREQGVSPGHGGREQGAHAGAQAGAQARRGAQAGREQTGGTGVRTNAQRAQEARTRVREYFASNPGATVVQAARELDMSRNTVSKYRP